MKMAFLDRDGTLIWEPPETKQVDSLEKLRILSHVGSGLRTLREEGFSLVLVSNQDGLGTDSFPEEHFREAQEELERRLARENIAFDHVLVCPHQPQDGCSCRKPQTGLVQPLLESCEVDLGNSLMVGDRDSDAEFARRLGVSFVKMTTNESFPRFARAHRETTETNIEVLVNLDGTGRAKVSTGIGFFDHMLELLAHHSLVDLNLNTSGDLDVDEHHTVEDTGLVLGQAISRALGDRSGIERYGFWVPMDEALAEVVIDISGRPCLVFAGAFQREYVGKLPTELVAHFFGSFSQALGCSLHMKLHRGSNEHHKVEALFKGLGRCLRVALRDCPHQSAIPSTKGLL